MIKIIYCPILGIKEFIFDAPPVEKIMPSKKQNDYSFNWDYMFRGMNLNIKRKGNRFRHLT